MERIPGGLPGNFLLPSYATDQLAHRTSSRTCATEPTGSYWHHWASFLTVSSHVLNGISQLLSKMLLLTPSASFPPARLLISIAGKTIPVLKCLRSQKLRNVDIIPGLFIISGDEENESFLMCVNLLSYFRRQSIFLPKNKGIQIVLLKKHACLIYVPLFPSDA